MKNPKVLLFFILLGRGLPCLADAGAVGTTSANFLKIPVPARSAGMGEAFSALSDDEGGFFYNPAGMARLFNNQISATHIQWFQGFYLEHLGNLIALGDWGAFGQSITWLHADPQQATQRIGSGAADPVNNYIVLGSFTPQDFNLELSYAYPWGPHLSLGANLMLIRQNIDQLNGWGVEGDLGLHYKDLLPNLDFGLVAHDLGSQVSLGSGASTPLLLNAGLAYALMNRDLLIAAEAEIPSDNQMEYSIGAEYWLYHLLALRAGYKLGYLNQYSAGLGFKLAGFLLDYSFTPYGELGNGQRLSATYEFGAPEVGLSADRALLAPRGAEAFRATRFSTRIPHPELVRHWQIVLNDKQVLFEGSQAPLQALTWSGLDNQGQPAPEGFSHAVLKVQYRDHDESISKSLSLEIDQTPPEMRLQLSPAVPSRPNSVQAPLLIQASLADKHGVGPWVLAVYDSQNRLYASFSGSGTSLAQTWDGSDGKGHYIQSGELCHFVLQAADGLGNRGQKAVQANVYLPEIRFSLSSDLLFKPGKAELGPEANQALSQAAAAIQKYRKEGAWAEVIGYTDNAPIHFSSYPNNLELSKARAQAVASALNSYFNIPPSILRPIGKGEASPLADNSTPQGQQANRRVEIILHTRSHQGL